MIIKDRYQKIREKIALKEKRKSKYQISIVQSWFGYFSSGFRGQSQRHRCWERCWVSIWVTIWVPLIWSMCTVNLGRLLVDRNLKIRCGLCLWSGKGVKCWIQVFLRPMFFASIFPLLWNSIKTIPLSFLLTSKKCGGEEKIKEEWPSL